MYALAIGDRDSSIIIPVNILAPQQQIPYTHLSNPGLYPKEWKLRISQRHLCRDRRAVVLPAAAAGRYIFSRVNGSCNLSRSV